MNNDSESMTLHDRVTQKLHRMIEDRRCTTTCKRRRTLRRRAGGTEYDRVRQHCRPWSVSHVPQRDLPAYLDDRGVIAMECLQQMERVILLLVRPSGARVPRNGFIAERPGPRTGLWRSLEPGPPAYCAGAMRYQVSEKAGIYAGL